MALSNNLRNIFKFTAVLPKFYQVRTFYHLEYSPNAKLNKSIIDRYMCLPIPECKVQLKYVWIDGTGENLRSKSRTLDFVPACAKECPTWSYDGSSTYQAVGTDSDVNLCPCALYNDPFRRGNNRIVLCDTYKSDGKPTWTNHRCNCLEAMNEACEEEPMFGIEQEYQMLDYDLKPFGWPAMRGQPAPQGPYYCGVGADKVVARDLVEAHYRACLYAGVDCCGTNAEVMMAQWEFQVGICLGIKAGDDLWMGRFLLARIAEEYGISISYEPKMYPNWNGAGAHHNISTKSMRCDGGLKAIEEAICKLEKKHKEHLKVYDPHGGLDNVRRLTGVHETSSMEKFTHGIANRAVSVRVTREVAEKKKGHLEDRRPAANADPYSVTEALVRTILLDK